VVKTSCIVGGLVTSIRYRQMRTQAERLAWLITVAANASATSRLASGSTTRYP